MEEIFNKSSLEYKLSNIGQAKGFARYLDEINCFYTDRSVDFEMVTEFSDKEKDIIGRLEHMRWLLEHESMGWRYGDEYISERDGYRIIKQDKAMRERERIHLLMMAEPITPESAGRHYDELPLEEQKKDYEPLDVMMKLIKKYDGLRIYRLG